jgi:hypothetical protein
MQQQQQSLVLCFERAAVAGDRAAASCPPVRCHTCRHGSAIASPTTPRPGNSVCRRLLPSCMWRQGAQHLKPQHQLLSHSAAERCCCSVHACCCCCLLHLAEVPTGVDQAQQHTRLLPLLQLLLLLLCE